MSKRVHAYEHARPRTRHRTGSLSRSVTSHVSGVSHLPSALVSGSIGAFLDTPMSAVARRMQQARRVAALRAHARAEHAPPPAASRGEDDEDEEPGVVVREPEEVAHPALRRASLPDMNTADMRKFVTARVIRALTRLAEAPRKTTFMSILPLRTYAGAQDGQSRVSVVATASHVSIFKERRGGWTVRYWFKDDSGFPADADDAVTDFTDARLAHFLPFIYPPPHDRKANGRLAGPESIQVGDASGLRFEGIPDKGLADAIALCLGPHIRPGHVVAAFQLDVEYMGELPETLHVYDVQTDAWQTL
jgi:hypothetical protein